MPLYEHVFVARQDISPAQVEALTDELQGIIREHGGDIKKAEYWGLRTLAYPIKKVRKGHYSLLNLDAPASAIHELERRHRINDDVMRYMTIKVDELDDEPSAMLSRKSGGRRD